MPFFLLSTTIGEIDSAIVPEMYSSPMLHIFLSSSFFSSILIVSSRCIRYNWLFSKQPIKLCNNCILGPLISITINSLSLRSYENVMNYFFRRAKVDIDQPKKENRPGICMAYSSIN